VVSLTRRSRGEVCEHNWNAWIFVYCTVISTLANLLPIGNFFQTPGYD
jgi:hypothetical protein